MQSEYLKPNDPAFCLSHLIEEMGEALAAAGKLQRWGPQSVNPTLPVEQQETNIDWLLREMDDVEAAIQRFRSTLNQQKGLHQMTDDLRTGLARAIAKDVVASRKMQRDNGLVYGAAYEAAVAALAQFTAHLASEVMVERIARALCEAHIRNVRRHDTTPERLDEMMAEAVDYSWTDFVGQARAVIAAQVAAMGEGHE